MEDNLSVSGTSACLFVAESIQLINGLSINRFATFGNTGYGL